MRSVSLIERRRFEANETRFELRGLPEALREFTYGIRATTPGRYTMLPAQIDVPDASGSTDAAGVSTPFTLRVESPRNP